MVYRFDGIGAVRESSVHENNNTFNDSTNDL